MNLNYGVIIKMIGAITTITGVAMFPALITSCIYGEYDVARSFLICALSITLIGAVTLIRTKPVSVKLRLKDGYLVVALCWLTASVLGGMPYLLCNLEITVIDAFFESVSGFTTTGCTVLNMSVVPNGLIMWKAISHWLGGMGILVFVISILPTFGIGGQTILKAEAPGPRLEKMSTRISDSAKMLYIVYISFSVIEFILLLFSDMNAFEAIVNTLGSISSGGLFSHSEGFSYFDSTYVEMVISIFTLLASVNFVLYGFIIKGRWREFFADIELRAFLGIIGTSVVLVTFGLYFYGTYDSIFTAARHAFFQTASFISTSGYAITDYDAWPAFCRVIIFSLMFIGGCGASTAGSIKVIRIVIFGKLIARSFYKKIHPRAVVAVKLGGKAVPAPMVSAITSFILLYFFIFIIGCLVLSLQNLDMITTISSSATALSNTGIGFGQLSASGDFSIFAPPLRLFLCLLMIMGRLEIFTVILLFMPSFWKNNR